jgi:hypothetical protein
MRGKGILRKVALFGRCYDPLKKRILTYGAPLASLFLLAQNPTNDCR